LEELEQLHLDREILLFKDRLKDYKGFLEKFERLFYLINIDDEFLMKNYSKFFKNKKTIKPAFENETNK
jgi:hypothetical protein